MTFSKGVKLVNGSSILESSSSYRTLQNIAIMITNIQGRQTGANVQTKFTLMLSTPSLNECAICFFTSGQKFPQLNANRHFFTISVAN